jgi:isoaspartyl peptidase/L-asparaginase-like protein (Ntn-hydrolase superfamily)
MPLPPPHPCSTLSLQACEVRHLGLWLVSSVKGHIRAVVEEDPALGPYFVGVGGLPNDEGNIECDAAVMRGSDCKVGAVAALQRFACTRGLKAHNHMFSPCTHTSVSSPISVALSVFNHCRHSMLSGLD